MKKGDRIDVYWGNGELWCEDVIVHDFYVNMDGYHISFFNQGNDDYIWVHISQCKLKL